MSEAALLAAREINEIGPAGWPWDATVEHADLLVDYVPTNADSRAKMVSALCELVEGIAPDGADSLDVLVASRRCATIMYFLTAGPPFATRLAVVDGYCQMTPLAYVDIPDLPAAGEWVNTALGFTQWVELSLFPIRGALLDLMREGSDTPNLKRLRESAALSAAGTADDMLARAARIDPAIIHMLFFERISKLNDLATTTWRKLYALSVLRSARFSPRNMMLGLCAASLAVVVLVVGVLIPIIHTSAPRWIYAWIPACIYLTGAMLGLGFFIGRVWRDRSDGTK